LLTTLSEMAGLVTPGCSSLCKCILISTLDSHGAESMAVSCNCSIGAGSGKRNFGHDAVIENHTFLGLTVERTDSWASKTWTRKSVILD
jgi:hypothetical protein